MASRREVEIKFTADDSQARSTIDDLIKKVDKLSGPAAEVLLTTNAEAVSMEIATLLADIDKLDAADPEVTVKSEQVNGLVGDLERIKGKLDEVRSADVTIDTSGARRNIDDLSVSAGSSRSVLANMIGNSVQDLGALGGVAGSAGVAIGQMGEYMADAMGSGDKFSAVLKNFGSVAGPLAGLALLTMAFQSIRDAQEEARRKAEEFMKAQRELAEGDTGAFVTVLKDQYGDLIAMLDDAGISYAEFARAVQTGEGLEDLQTRLQDAGLAAEVFGADRLAGLTEQFAENRDAMAEEDEQTRQLTEGFGDLTDASGDVVSAQDALADGIKVVTDALTEQADAQREAMAAAEEQANAMRAAADAQFALRDAQRDWEETSQGMPARLAEIAASEGDAATKTREWAAALDAGTQSAISLADSVVRVYDEQATANGITLSAVEKASLFNQAMIDQAATADGPLRSSILDYIGQVNQIPPEKLSDIRALIDQGKLDEAKALLDEGSAPRDALLEADATGVPEAKGELDAAAVARVAKIIADAQTGAAESALNNTARTRTAIINAVSVVSQVAAGMPKSASLALAPAEATVTADGRAAPTVYTGTLEGPAAASSVSTALHLTVQGNIYGDNALRRVIGEILATHDNQLAQSLGTGVRR